MAYYFNLPPIDKLTLAQQAALNHPEPIALSGGPGTGKSIVSLYRHIRLHEQGKQSLLLTYTTTLKRYMEGCCKNENPAAAAHVGSCFRNKPKRNWSEIIIDEAQDLPIDYYEEISEYGPISYGADASQTLYPDHCSTMPELNGLFGSNRKCVLDKNFRCTRQIMEFVKKAFPDAPINMIDINKITKTGDKPRLIVTDGDSYDDTNDEQNDAIIEIINDFRSSTHNIAILVPWKKHVKVFEEVLEDNGISGFSAYAAGDDCTSCPPIENIHITTFKSAKGLEFDTVIIPNFELYNKITGKFNIEWKDYYVGCTRAKSNLFLISNSMLPGLASVVD